METVNPALFNSMEWRLIGPHRGGRVVAVAGDPQDPMTFYFGACAGGLWKTTDGGTYWRNVTDGFPQRLRRGCRRRRQLRFQRHLRGHWGSLPPRQRLPRRRDIPLHRRRSNLGPLGPRRHSPRLQSAHTSTKPRPSLRGSHGPRLRPQRAAWRFPLHERWQILGEGALQEPASRGRRPFYGPQQPQDSFRPPYIRRSATPGPTSVGGPTAASIGLRTEATRGRTFPTTQACPRD